jgi:hypothetical protein
VNTGVAVTVGVRVTEGVQVGKGVHLDQTEVGVGEGSAHTTRQPLPCNPQVHGLTVGGGGASGVSTAGGVGVGAWARADANGSKHTISERDT